ncbi:hypothetical protein WJX72_011602 [[Myrmecia] bisecta]|uniref:Selenoprotein F n=1 Tax=[Myrmecia] bisecta TaxID=41462 RepID=A0AAW1PH83_9CHLO
MPLAFCCMKLWRTPDLDFPHIETFVRKKAKDYKGLTVIDRFGALPRLVLKAGKDRETIRIDKWKTEHIEEFLQDKLLH